MKFSLLALIPLMAYAAVPHPRPRQFGPQTIPTGPLDDTNLTNKILFRFHGAPRLHIITGGGGPSVRGVILNANSNVGQMAVGLTLPDSDGTWKNPGRVTVSGPRMFEQWGE